MAATQASIGYGAVFALGDDNSPESFTSLAEVISITPPADAVDVVEATHMSSPNRTREFIASLIDPGEASIELNFVPGGADDDLIQAWKAAGNRRSARITFPNSVIWTFEGILIGYEHNVPLDDKMTSTLTIKVTGSYTVS